VPAPYASVLIPAHNPGDRIRTVLAALAEQDVDFDFETLVVDSGSTDGSLDIMRGFRASVTQIPPHEFGHGSTRNLLATKARGKILLYLSQDAVPASRDWMRTLVATLNDPLVAGAYARQLACVDADPAMQFFLSRMYGPTFMRRRMPERRRPHLREVFFSNVSSAVRRSVWELVPFRADVAMSEDQYWAADVLGRGYDVVYQPQARVYHSHHYTLRSLFRRNRLSGYSLGDLVTASDAKPSDGFKYVFGEAAFIIRSRQFAWLPYVPIYEAARASGFLVGLAQAQCERATMIGVRAQFRLIRRSGAQLTPTYLRRRSIASRDRF
jgi:rhamnosyltransferase